jgi:hypothetical protein
VVGASAIDDSYSVGNNNVIQLPGPQGCGSFTVLRVNYGVAFGGTRNNIDAVPSSVDSTNGTFISNTAPDGSKYFSVAFTCLK